MDQKIVLTVVQVASLQIGGQGIQEGRDDSNNGLQEGYLESLHSAHSCISAFWEDSILSVSFHGYMGWTR